MDRRRYRSDRGQIAGIPPFQVRDLLSVSSGDAVGLPTEMASAPAVSADARYAGDARSVGFVDLSGRLRKGSAGAVDHVGIGAARSAGVSRHCPGTAWGIEAPLRNRDRYRCATFA